MEEIEIYNVNNMYTVLIHPICDVTTVLVHPIRDVTTVIVHPICDLTNMTQYTLHSGLQILYQLYYLTYQNQIYF